MENNLNLTPEQLEQAEAATSAAELLALAQESGIPLTAEQAEAYYAQLHPEMGTIADEGMDNVSGGFGYGNGCPTWSCKLCGGATRPHRLGSCPSNRPVGVCLTCKSYEKERCTILK